MLGWLLHFNINLIIKPVIIINNFNVIIKIYFMLINNYFMD